MEYFLVMIAFLLVLASIFDFEKRIIPDFLPLAILICGLWASWIHGVFLLALFLTLVAAAFIIMLFSFDVLGGGDLKLLVVLAPAFSLMGSLYWGLLGLVLFLGLMFVSWGILIVALRASGREIKGTPLAPLILLSWIIGFCLFFY